MKETFKDHSKDNSPANAYIETVKSFPKTVYYARHYGQRHEMSLLQGDGNADVSIDTFNGNDEDAHSRHFPETVEGIKDWLLNSPQESTSTPYVKLRRLHDEEILKWSKGNSISGCSNNSGTLQEGDK